MKLYFLLNMEYSDDCKHILHFLQRSVFSVPDNLSLGRSNVDLSVYIRNKRHRN